MTEQVKVPAIRFAGFTDPWEQHKLENLVSLGGGYAPSMTDASDCIDGKTLWVTPQDVKQRYIENITMMVSKKGATTLTLYPSDSIVMIVRSGVLRHTIPVVELRKPATVNQGIKVIQTVDSCDSPWFLQYFIASSKTLPREYGKTRTTTEGTDSVKMKSMALMVPCIEEQQTIGSSLFRPDNLITLHQRKYDKLVIFKESMLRKMFPRNGESVSEIHFAGFTDPWEQRKLGEIVSIGVGAPPNASSAGDFPYVKVDDLNESSRSQFDFAQRVDANATVKPTRKGSTIFAKRRAVILGNKVRVLGRTACIDTNMMALEPRSVDTGFLWLFINQTGLYRIADTSTIPQISNKHIEPYPIDIPNIIEQQAIGTFSPRLNDLITLHQRKLELSQDIEESPLDKMLV